MVSIGIVARRRRRPAGGSGRRSKKAVDLALSRFSTTDKRDQSPDVQEDDKYMNPEQLDYFRQLLVDQLNSLDENAGNAHGKLISEPKNLPDELDQAAEEDNRRTELRIRDRERKLINKIKETLEKIDNGEYGYCKSCSYPIGQARLEARPTADLCINCKDLEEQEERQFGG